MAKFDFKKLRDSIDWSVRQLKVPRDNRLKFIKEYVGMNYAQSGSDKKNPTNFLELAITIYTRQLMARAPRVMVTAKNVALKPFAKDMEIAINQIPDEIGLGKTLQRAVMEAMFSFAIAKVGICQTGRIVLGHDPGQLFVDLVSIDDYFCDMSAKSRDRMQYEGNEYWMDIEDARAMYKGPSVDLQPDEHTTVSPDGDTKADSVTVGDGADVYSPRILMRDVWLPGVKKVITYAVSTNLLVAEVEWDGPENGPYYTLGFSEVPGNLLPLPPVALWYDMHELGNSIFRKLGRQADAKKTVVAFAGGNDESVNSLKAARDGDGITFTGARPENITVGGIDAPTLAFYLQLRDLFNYFAGNLDSLGGLSPVSDTVGQEKMMSEAANARLAAMSDSVMEFVRGIMKAIAWYEWTNPYAERTIVKELKGTDIAVTKKWSPETMAGDFLDYNFDIDVYSMQDDSPANRLQKLGAALERFVFPIIGQIEAQGGQFNTKVMLETISELSDLPELADMVVFQEPSEAGQQPIQGSPQARHERSLPSQTKRTYERVSRPGATRSGKDDVMSRLLMGGNVQAGEGSAMGRLVG
jgi:hypothetical protein